MNGTPELKNYQERFFNLNVYYCKTRKKSSFMYLAYEFLNIGSR